MDPDEGNLGARDVAKGSGGGGGEVVMGVIVVIVVFPLADGVTESEG